MEKSLVTKYNREVNNSELRKQGTLRFHVSERVITNNNQYGISIETNGEPARLSVIGDGYFGTSLAGIETQKLKEINLSQITRLYFKNGNYDVEIDNKYCLVGISCHGADSIVEWNIDDLADCNNLVYISVANTRAKGSIDSLKKLTSITTLRLARTGIDGDVSALSRCNLEVLSCPQSNICGDIKAFKDMTNIQVLSIGTDLFYGDIASLAKCTSLIEAYFGLVDVYGTIESFVEGQIANGRTTPSQAIFMQGILYKCKFGGKNYYGESASFLYWESLSRVFIYIGSADVAQATKIFAKGATQEEIAAWENAGKTVVVVN